MELIVCTNMNGGKSAMFHVHAADCRDLTTRKYKNADKYEVVLATFEAVIEDTYFDQIAEAENRDVAIAEFADDFAFYACCGHELNATKIVETPVARVQTATTNVTFKKEGKWDRWESSNNFLISLDNRSSMFQVFDLNVFGSKPIEFATIADAKSFVKAAR